MSEPVSTEPKSWFYIRPVPLKTLYDHISSYTKEEEVAEIAGFLASPNKRNDKTSSKLTHKSII